MEELISVAQGVLRNAGHIFSAKVKYKVMVCLLKKRTFRGDIDKA